MGPRILITISRTWPQIARLRRELTKVYTRFPDAVLVHGDARKGDRTAAGIWKSLGGVDEPVPADWDNCGVDCAPGHRRQRRGGTEFCPVAGHRRNQEMVETAPDLVLSFIWKKSGGATDCTDRAEAAGLRIVRYTDEDAEETA